MNNPFSLIIVGGLAVLTIGADPVGAQTACNKRILNRSGCEVGDFEAPSQAPRWIIMQSQIIRTQRTSFGTPFGAVTPKSNQAVNYQPQNRALQLFHSALRKQVKNDLAGAIDDYLAALKLEDKDPAVHWYLGTAYQAAGQSDKAKLEFAIEQQMKKDRLTSTVYQGGYGNGTGTGFPMGNFGSAKLYIVPGRGVTKGWNPY